MCWRKCELSIKVVCLRFPIKPFDHWVNRRLNLVIYLIRYNYVAGWKRARRINTYYRRLCIVDGLSIQPRWWRYMVIHLKIIEPVPPHFSVCHWKFIESLMYGALSGGPMASCLCPTRGRSPEPDECWSSFASICRGQFWNIVPIIAQPSGSLCCF